ncbi:MAG TPA: alpha-ketoglutarate-dependent dioxygenase AlkB [Acidimicrobiales bacterium]|nr:alpha-ketoglutarate-dependent dioxygenase AlkB [Acidimicrobiales bacterium]
MVARQGSLFDLGEAIEPRAGESGVSRTDLGHGAWIDVGRDWLAGADPLFDRLFHAVEWRAEQRPMYDRVVDVPRLMHFYDTGESLPDPALDQVREALTHQYRHEVGGPFCTAGLCLYRDGRDSVAWHGDRIGRGAIHDTLVAIISLGSPRRMLLRPRGGGRAQRYELGHGDLLVMGGSCQRTWEHAIPKTTQSVGPRISIQFRPDRVR